MATLKTIFWRKKIEKLKMKFLSVKKLAVLQSYVANVHAMKIGLKKLGVRNLKYMLRLYQMALVLEVVTTMFVALFVLIYTCLNNNNRCEA